ncbi:hypothetical protein FQA39_LY19439 [Lamprigera yunnana]|nr:hypothetical protein FQA39_LY19439 [Lamprigera yunnana]
MQELMGKCTSLYDNDKVKQPKLDGLEEAKSVQAKDCGFITLFCFTNFQKFPLEFKAKYPNRLKLVTSSIIPYAAGLDAAQEVFGKEQLPV